MIRSAQVSLTRPGLMEALQAREAFHIVFPAMTGFSAILVPILFPPRWEDRRQETAAATQALRGNCWLTGAASAHAGPGASAPSGLDGAGRAVNPEESDCVNNDPAPHWRVRVRAWWFCLCALPRPALRRLTA